jgi:hypothetical protein
MDATTQDRGSRLRLVTGNQTNFGDHDGGNPPTTESLKTHRQAIGKDYHPFAYPDSEDASRAPRPPIFWEASG